MEVRPGYKQTEVGVIPEDWEALSARQVGVFKGGSGFPLAAQGETSGEYPFFKVSDMNNEGNETFMTTANHYISEQTRRRLGATAFPAESIVFAKVGAAVFLERKKILGQASCIDNNMAAFDLDKARVDVRYMHSLLLSKKLSALVATTALPALNGKQLGEMMLPVPPLPEQRAIAAALSDVDALLEGQTRLIAKKRDLKQAAMQQLLTGQTRLPGFSGEWEVKRIAEIAVPCTEKNTDGAMLPVLACSKHFGFMDSLGFFKNRVFSKDLSTYKVIRRDEIGYPANHVEEGSIGLQDLYDTALVSPIYVVFRVAGDVCSFFLHRLLKLDSYRQRFKTATTSSVDRRGSLRWPAFSDITVDLPPTKAEQTAIAAVLSDMDAEISALAARRDKTRALKQAMMQELLTGRTRLV